jgi:hypothetical protein
MEQFTMFALLAEPLFAPSASPRPRRRFLLAFSRFRRTRL